MASHDNRGKRDHSSPPGRAGSSGGHDRTGSVVTGPSGPSVGGGLPSGPPSFRVGGRITIDNEEMPQSPQTTPASTTASALAKFA